MILTILLAFGTFFFSSFFGVRGRGETSKSSRETLLRLFGVSWVLALQMVGGDPKAASLRKDAAASFFAYNWKLPADSGALLLTVDNFSFFGALRKGLHFLKKREGVPEMGTKPLKALRGYRASNRGSENL